MTPRVCGIDLSLTSTGLADNQGRVARIRTKPAGDFLPDQVMRLRAIREGIYACIRTDGVPDLVAIEGPAMHAKGSAVHQTFGLWWVVVDSLVGNLLPVLVVPPTTRAMYATGRGNAGKDEVLAAAIRRYPAWDITGNDVGDAVVLCALGSRLLGHPIEESMPQAHLRALAKLELPGGAA